MAFLDAVVRFTRSRKEFLNKEQIEERLNICIPCEHYIGHGCKICGCCVNDKTTLFNKIALPTERCPESKWEEKT